MAYVVMAIWLWPIGMAYIVMAYIVMAHIGMAYVVYGPYSYGPYTLFAVLGVDLYRGCFGERWCAPM